MPESRLTAYQDRHDYWRLSARFDAVERSIEESRLSGQPVFVTGPNIYEEFQSYAHGKSRYVEYSGLIINSKADHPFDALRDAYWGKTASLRKIVGFLNGTQCGLTGTISIADLSEPDQDLIELIIEKAKAEFINSRKNPSGADAEFEIFLDKFDSVPIPGPIVMTVSRHGLTYLQWIVIGRLLLQENPTPTVILVDRDAESVFEITKSYKRVPVTGNELFEFLSQEFGKSSSELKRLYDLWHASRGARKPKLALDEDMSLSEGSSFVSFVRNFDTDETPVELATRSIPQRIVAPLMFVAGAERIDVDHEAAKGISAASAKGAARALKNQANDVVSSGGISNSVPGLSQVLKRISQTAEKLELSSPPEEGDIVELGVDVSYLEHRVYEAKDRIGEVSLGEVLAFVGEANRYLSRFEAWRTYREETGQTLGASAEVSALAHQLLVKAAEAGLLTDEARARVLTTLHSDVADEDANRREGIARSSENLTSVVSRGALKALEAGGKDLAKEARSQAAKGLVDKSQAFLIANAPALMRLAQLRAGKWLEMVANLFS